MKKFAIILLAAFAASFVLTACSSGGDAVDKDTQGLKPLAEKPSRENQGSPTAAGGASNQQPQ